MSIRQAAMFGAAIIALSFLYYKTQAIDLERHGRTEQTLRDIKQWDAQLKQDILRTRTGLLNHYDTLVDTSKALKSAYQKLIEKPSAIPALFDAASAGKLFPSLDAFGDDWNNRTINLERFKSKNAILKNSLSFLPVAAGMLTDRFQPSGQPLEVAETLNRVIRDTLIFNLSGSEALLRGLEGETIKLLQSANALDEETREEIDNILLHVAVILEQKPELDELVADLTSARSAALIDNVISNYNSGFAKLEGEANAYRALLYGLSVLLLVYIAYILLQLKRAAVSLERANEELEDRVAARTAELQETNRSLSEHLERLGLAMEKAEGGDFDVHLPPQSEEVYAVLYNRFNRMIDGIRDESQILKVAQELSGELHLDVLLARIMSTTTELLDADRSTLFVHDSKTKELWSRVAEGVDTKEIRFPDNIGIAGKVFSTGEPENISDPYAHALFNPAVDRETGYKTESILCMPIIDKSGACIGVTQVLNKSDGIFLSRDEARLKAFTAQVGVSLANAQLFSDVIKEKNYNEATLNSMSNGVVTFDEDTRVSTMNPAAARILSRDPAGLIGKDAAEVFGGRKGWISNEVIDLLRTGQADSFVDVDVSLKDGQSASVNLAVVPLRGEAEETIGGMLILEDITNEKRVKNTMARYMTREIAEQLMEVGEDALGGKSQTATVLFSDIRRFTTISEKLGARATVTMLNEYFTEMIEVIFNNKGILDKYIGDAIMAVFGTPFPTDADTDNAVIVANRMIEVLRDLNGRRAAAGKDLIEIGVGLSTGELISGNIGSPKRMDYTVIGDSVNLAARLESATKYYGVSVLVSEFTVNACRGSHNFRELDLIIVKGKTKPVAVYEALDHHNSETFANMPETLAAFSEGLLSYRSQNWPVAAEAFERALASQPHDRPSQLYLERCSYYLENPPPENWNGVWEMANK